MGTCGISHRWSSSREDCSRSSSSNNSDIEDLRQVIVRLFRSRNIPIVIVLTCWTTGRRQPWRCHIWQQLTLRPSLTFLPANSNTNLQHTGSVPRQFILVAAHKSHARALSNSATMRVHTMTSASRLWFRCHCFPPGWLRHAGATYSEAGSPNPEPPGPHTTSLNIPNCHLVPRTLLYNLPSKTVGKSGKKLILLKFLLAQTIN